MTQTLGFLKKLLDTPGPSGFDAAPARVWRDEVQGSPTRSGPMRTATRSRS